MMRVYVVASLKGGLASFTRRDLVGLAERGCDISVLPTKVAPGSVVPRGMHLAYTGRLARVGWALVGLCGLLRTHSGRLLVLRAVKAREPICMLLACSFHATLPRPDVVYAVFGDRKLFTGYFLSLLWDSPLVVTVHAYELYNNPNPTMFATALDHCRRVLTVTEHNRDLLVEKWKVAPEKVEVVRVSVDTELFSPAERFVVLIAGSVSHRKGHATLFEAVGILQDRDIEVWVVGDAAGAHPQEPRKLARAYGVEGQCVFLGWQPEAAVAALMRRADVLCAPSRQDPSGNLEGFPTVLAEAMFLGLPVITTRHSEIPAVVSATVVPEDCPYELAAAISRYKSSAAARAEDAARNQGVAARLFGGNATERLIAELEAVSAVGRQGEGIAQKD